MNQQPDKLFREKLAGYQKPAPAGAWDRIEAGLHKKNDSGLWWKVAASLLLIAAATFILWPAQNIDKDTVAKDIEKTNPPKSATPAQEMVPNAKTDVTIAAKDQQKVEQPKEKRKPSFPINAELKETPELAAKTEVELEKPIIESPAENDSEMVAQVETQVSTPETLQQENTVAAIPHGITLVITREETNEFIDNKKIEGEATTTEKEASTLRKLLKKANTLANNQDPFGGLRQKKNEILALNFKSEKQRGQKQQ